MIVLEIGRKIWIIFYSCQPKCSQPAKAFDSQTKRQWKRGEKNTVRPAVGKKNQTGQNGRTQVGEAHQAENISK